MPQRVHELGGGLDPPNPLGANHSRLPAAALFFQPASQRDILARALGALPADWRRAWPRGLLSPHPHGGGLLLRTKTHAPARLQLALARAGERLAPNGDLGAGLLRKPHP